MDNVVTRTESDFIGRMELPERALYGVNTARGAENFAISGVLFESEPQFIKAFAQIKRAAARANRELGLLSDTQAEAIDVACDEAANGLHNRHFIIDLLEGSGGTSLNMNVNEVLTNRALTVMGEKIGAYSKLHPNDHVNRSQSTNDVVPSAIKLAAFSMLGDLIGALEELRDALQEKASEFEDVLRLGRTCLQDGQPMTLGQAFGGYASLVKRLLAELRLRRADLIELPLGGTAIGTGLGAPEGYRALVFKHLSEITSQEWLPAEDVFDAMQNTDVFGRLSGELKTAAMSLAKIGSDFILLSSGPAGGIGELRLPPLQAGSSIMPGKVNPVQPMALCQVSFAVAGHDVSIGIAVQQGQLEVNHYEPLIAAYLFSSIRMLTNEIRLFANRCVKKVEADKERNLHNLLSSSAIATALVPSLGYETTAKLVRDSVRSGRTFLEVASDAGHLSQDEAVALIKSAVKR